MQGSNNHVKFDSAAYFSTPIWTAHAPVFLKKMLKLSDGYLKETKKTVMAKAIKERDKKFNDALGQMIMQWGMNQATDDEW